MSRENDQSRLFGVFFYPALILGILIIVALLVASYSGGGTSQSQGNKRQLSSDMMNKLQSRYDALGMSMGPKNAPVTIREFGDYQCPACGAFEPTARKLRKNFVKTGKARYIFFDFPLPMHAHAHEAALAARCAARQDKFWPYHNRLYATQRTWAEKKDPTSAFLDIAVETGVNTKRLKQCIAQSATGHAIKQEKALGKKLKLRATPTVMIGDTLYTGAASYQELAQAIRARTPAHDRDDESDK